MTYVVTENCIKCKFQDCVEVCPVDCFYEGENFLVIHPEECIDCGVCEPECPVDAIKADTEPNLEQWLEINRKYSEVWPNITEIGTVPADADDWKGVPDKLKYLIAAGLPEPAATVPPTKRADPQSRTPQPDGYELDGLVIEGDDGVKGQIPAKPIPPLSHGKAHAEEAVEIEGLTLDDTASGSDKT